jgi:hypothetical protein
MIMDPNAALTEIRKIVAKAGAGQSFDADRLAELFSGLDSWICGGGFLPSDWAR